MQRKNREIVIFNLSAIDLFCSGMGAVMVLMVLLMPYYRKQAPVPPQPPVPAPVVATVAPPVPEPPVPVPPVPEPEKGIRIRAIDVVFVMDATMSMQQELDEVREGMTSIVQVLRRLSDEVSVGFVAYIDRSVPWVISPTLVTRGDAGDLNLKRFLQEIAKVELVGNSDWPEDVCGGLEKAVAARWPALAEDRSQIIVLIGDARTHPEDHDRSFEIVRGWVGQSQGRSVNTVLSGTPDADFPEEFPAAGKYFEEIATAGKGQYVQNQGDLMGSILDILIVR